MYFNPRPPRGERLCNAWSHGVAIGISIHALREEGDTGQRIAAQITGEFQSTPSARRATRFPRDRSRRQQISIHALREEGDQAQLVNGVQQTVFQSTPSARRATVDGNSVDMYKIKFQSTPSARRATLHGPYQRLERAGISIHALREEGDHSVPISSGLSNYFNPRPPRGGRLGLRYEGDNAKVFQSTPSARRATSKIPAVCMSEKISIHALREEGDCLSRRRLQGPWNFNPRPPRGGRPGRPTNLITRQQISIHALREEGDTGAHRTSSGPEGISIHALREEGDGSGSKEDLKAEEFQSTPSARRATFPLHFSLK